MVWCRLCHKCFKANATKCMNTYFVHGWMTKTDQRLNNIIVFVSQTKMLFKRWMFHFFFFVVDTIIMIIHTAWKAFRSWNLGNAWIWTQPERKVWKNCFTNFTVTIHVSRNVRKRTFWHVRPTKTQISLRIRAVWSVFVVRMKKLCIVGYLKCAQGRF